METEESSRCLDRLEILKFRELLLLSSRCLWRLNAAAEPDIGANFKGGLLCYLMNKVEREHEIIEFAQFAGRVFGVCCGLRASCFVMIIL